MDTNKSIRRHSPLLTDCLTRVLAWLVHSSRIFIAFIGLVVLAWQYLVSAGVRCSSIHRLTQHLLIMTQQSSLVTMKTSHHCHFIGSKLSTTSHSL